MEELLNFSRPGRLRCTGQANTRADMHCLTLDDRWRRQRIVQTRNDLPGFGLRRRLQQDRELVTSQAGRRIAVAQAATHPIGDILKQ